MGTDLVLPAVPWLPDSLGGTLAQSQLVLAAYVGGTCIGLLAYGVLGDHFGTRALFTGSLVAARGDDARGAALVILFILGIAATGTAVAAPLLQHGLAPIAGIACALELLAVLCLALLPAQRPQP